MNVRRVYASVVINLKHFFREKSSVFFVLLFPILLILLFGFIFQGQGDISYQLHVQNLDDGAYSGAFIAMLNASYNDSQLFVVKTIPADEDAIQYFDDNNLNTAVVIPADYTDHILQMQYNYSQGNATSRIDIQVIFDDSNSAAMTKVTILGSMIEGFNKNVTGGVDFIGAEHVTTTSDEFDFIDFFVPGIIGMSVMTSSLFGTVGMITELKQKGILRKLATTPLTRAEWIVANVLYQFVMALMSTIVILIVGISVFGLQPKINIFLFLFIILNVFAFGGIGMLITRFVKEAESAQAAANAVMFPMMFLSGTFFSFEMMPEFLRAIANFLPLYYVNEGLRAAMIEIDMAAIGYNALVVFIFAMVVFILGVFLTTWKDD